MRITGADRTMRAGDLLLTLAQLAVTLVGFSALVVLFQNSREGSLDGAE